MSDTHSDEFPAPQPEIAADQVELTPVPDELPALEPEVPLPPCHVMLDLETWGTGNNAVIVSIGACKFDRNDILDKFHVGVDPKSGQYLGLQIEADTILWWMDPAQREALDSWLQLERVDLASALVGFEMWCKNQPGVLAIWGNGATFDNVILRSSYAAAGLEYPVRFWQDQCYRTKKNEVPFAIQREGQHHRALDDAISQAKHLQAIWRYQDQTELRTMLERNEHQFRFYAQNHRDKVAPLQAELDRCDIPMRQNELRDQIATITEKADVNESAANDIRQLLDGGPHVSA